MARVGSLGVAALVCIGAVAAVAVLPVSNWSLRNQTDLIASGLGESANSMVFGGIGESPSYWIEGTFQKKLFDPDRWEAMTQEEELAKALPEFLKEGVNPGRFNRDAAYRPYTQLLEAYVHRHPDDLEANSHLIRLLCMSPLIDRFRGAKPRDAVSERRRMLNASLILEATIRGKRLDPDNGYFPTMKAVALGAIGRWTEAAKEVHIAAGLPRFEDYALNEAKVVLRVLERHVGYRGEAIRVLTYASVLMPQFASIRTLGIVLPSALSERDAVPVRWALFRLGDKLCLQSRTLVGIFLGRSLMGSAALCGDNWTGTKRRGERSRVDRNAVRLFAIQLRESRVPLGGHDPEEMFSSAAKLETAVHSWSQSSDAFNPYQPFPNAYFAAKALILLALLWPIGFLLSFVGSGWPGGLDQARGAIACFALCVALFTRVLQIGEVDPNWNRDGMALLLFVLAGGYGTLAIFLAKRGMDLAAITTGLALGSLGFFAVTGTKSELGLVIGLLNALCALLVLGSHRFRGASSILGLGLLVGAGLLFVDPVFGASPFGFAVAGLCVGVCLLLLLPIRRFRFSIVAAAYLACGAFLAGTASDVIQNGQYRALNESLMREADRAREVARIEIPPPR